MDREGSPEVGAAAVLAPSVHVVRSSLGVVADRTCEADEGLHLNGVLGRRARWWESSERTDRCKADGTAVVGGKRRCSRDCVKNYQIGSSGVSSGQVRGMKVGLRT